MHRNHVFFFLEWIISYIYLHVLVHVHVYIVHVNLPSLLTVVVQPLCYHSVCFNCHIIVLLFHVHVHNVHNVLYMYSVGHLKIIVNFIVLGRKSTTCIPISTVRVYMYMYP